MGKWGALPLETHRHSCPCVGGPCCLSAPFCTHTSEAWSLSSLCSLCLCTLIRLHFCVCCQYWQPEVGTNLLKHFLVFIPVLCIGDMGFFGTQEHKLGTLDSVVWNMGGPGACAIAASQEQPLILSSELLLTQLGQAVLSNSEYRLWQTVSSWLEFLMSITSGERNHNRTWDGSP